MPRKSEFLQIRVTPREKESLKRHATAAGQDLSSYVLSRALPPARLGFEKRLRGLREDGELRAALGELDDFLSALTPVELGDAVEGADPAPLSPFLRNYVAAIVERACHRKGVGAPAWAGRVAPLEIPRFSAPLKSLRMQLLRASPVPFKRRNVFVGAAEADRSRVGTWPDGLPDHVRRLFELLETELAELGAEGEIYLVGGAVMCLALDARPAGRDGNGYFRPTRVIRHAAARAATRTGARPDWLNGAVQTLLDRGGGLGPYLELPRLRVFIARPEYLLAMKCAAMRLGDEFGDLDDVRYLLRYLNVGSADTALDLVTRYVDEERLLPKTRLALIALLSG